MRSVLIAAVLLLIACRERALAPGVSDSTFVRAMSALRRLPAASVIDSLPRVRQRDSILRAHGLTAQQLEAAALALASDPKRASNLFRAIENRPIEPVPSPIRNAKKDGVTK